MNQPTSLATRFRWPLLLPGVVAVLAGVAYWLLLPTDPIGPQAFERIQLGMTEAEVEAVVGLPPGQYYSDGYARPERSQFEPSVSLITETGVPYEEFRRDQNRLGRSDRIPLNSWSCDRYWIKVGFGENSTAIGIYLFKVRKLDRFRPSLFERIFPTDGL